MIAAGFQAETAVLVIPIVAAVVLALLPSYRLTAQLNEQFGESAKLETAIRQNLKMLGYSLKEEKND